MGKERESMEQTGIFRLEQSGEALSMGRVVKDRRVSDVHLDPNLDNYSIHISTMRRLSQEINLSHHIKFIKIHIINTISSWRATIEPQNGTDVLEYIEKELKHIIIIVMS